MIVECYAADGWLMGEVLGSMRGPGPESLKITAYKILLFHVNTVYGLNSNITRGGI